MEVLVPVNVTRSLARDQAEYRQLPVADVVIINNPEVRNAQAHELLLDGGIPAMQSIWQPTPEELAILMRGGRLHLTILGRVHPPVSLEVHERPVPKGPRHVTTTVGMEGKHFAIVVVETKDGLDVAETGTGRYDSRADAEEEANTIAQMFGLPFRGAK